ncbi:hypothetical protein OSCI_3440014 [Kamptonema sp. PCC 6506]|nr:hypothetical protein OSCI_3440014 [Kamptonema sp. PCC 6506]
MHHPQKPVGAGSPVALHSTERLKNPPPLGERVIYLRCFR